MALSSSSTLAEVYAEYMNTADYRKSGSASEAQDHAIAISYLMVLLPDESRKGSSQVKWDKTKEALLQMEKREAIAYAEAVSSGGSSFIRADLTKLRGHG